MSLTRFSKFPLVVLAFALWAGTASAQVTSDTPTFAFSYTNGSTTASQSANISDPTSANAAYTTSVSYNVASGTNQWLTVASGGSIPGTLSLSIAAAASTMAPGNTYSATVTLTGVTDGTPDATIAVSLTVVSPLGATTPATAILTFAKGGPNSQAGASTTSSVTNSDASYDTYTTVKAVGCPTWFTVTSANNKQARATAADTLTFAINPTAANAASATSVTTCNVQLQYLGVTFKTVTFTSLNIVNNPLVATPSSVSLNYIKGTSTGTISTATTMTVATGFANTAYVADVGTVPLWLTVTPTTPATSSGVQVTFTLVDGTVASMATGNYTANVGFYATGYPEIYVAVTLTVSNSAPTVSLKEGASGSSIPLIWAPGMTTPQPTVTPFSSNEPVPFTATCTVSSTYSSYNGTTPCALNSPSSATASGLAYTWGYPLLVTLDPTLFTGAPLGTKVTVTVAVSPQGGSSLNLAYQYSLQPVAPTVTSIFPTSVAQIPASTSLVLLLKGTGFVGPQNLNPSATIVPTQVWIGSSTSALTSGYVVLSPTEMQVTIPQASFPTYATGKTSATLAIGIANQTGTSAPTAATATTTLTVTNAPVVYGITSTATYVQPAVGVNPVVAPYELVSIFGSNFGFSGSAYSVGTLTSFEQYPTSLVVSGSGKTAVNLSVAFKDGKNTYNAPILFANNTQINLAVPAELVVNDTVTVAVTSGTSSSDGLFAATVVSNDPGVFTLSSDGTGQGAIVNHDGTINSSGNGETPGNWVSLYVTGMGAPDGTALDAASNSGAVYPTNCVVISNTGKGTPGYLQVVNTAATGYTPPTPAWTSIDGAVILGSKILGGLPPCMTDNITVTFGSGGSAVTATTTGGGVLWAGFAAGSVAGLYQINVTIPANAPTGNTVPVSFTIGSYTSPTVTMAIQ